MSRRSRRQSREPAPRVAAGRRCHGRVLLRDVLSPRERVESLELARRRRAPPARRGGHAAAGSLRPPRAAGVSQRLLGDGAGPGARSPGDASSCRWRARLADGSEHVAPLGRIEIAEREPAPSAGAAPGAPDRSSRSAWRPTSPDSDLFRAQVESLRAQTDRRWRCVISDDCSSPERFAALAGDRGRRPRFVVSRSERRLGFYRNFERALRLAPARRGCWRCATRTTAGAPRSSRCCASALGGAQLVYSDQRAGRRRRARAARDAVARPAQQPHQPRVAAGGQLRSRAPRRCSAARWPSSPCPSRHARPAVPRPLDRRSWRWPPATSPTSIARSTTTCSTRGAVFGEVSGGRGAAAGRAALLRGGRGAYFLGYCRARCRPRRCSCAARGGSAPAKRRALRRYVASARSPVAFAWLAARPLRVLAGRNETLGSESELVHGIVVALGGGAARPGRCAGPGACPATPASPTR